MRLHQWLGPVALVAIVVLGLIGAPSGRSQATGPDRLVVHAALEGPIGPAAVRHVEQAVARSAESGAEALVLRINTPGGLADSMREIVSAILSSPVPVIGHVAPPGAHAASAGTYILYATHVAAMAPGTNLGAATPVQIGGGGLPGLPRDRDGAPGGGEGEAPADGGGASGEEDAGASPAPGDPMSAKAVNDAIALIRSLAELHGRNADWAESAVREAASLSSRQALEQGVIDLVAEDLDALLASADGRSVVVKGDERTLATRGAVVERFEPDAMTRILSILSNPNVALVLMMIGIYGIILEFWTPGAIGPGVVGAICLTLGLYALNQLPLDYAGLALSVLGVAFMVAETLTPAFGILGVGGIAAFVIGAAMLIDTDAPAYQISWWLIGGMAAVSASVLILLLGYTLKVYRRPPGGGREGLIGASARVLDWSGSEGHVWVHGERWRAIGLSGLTPGDDVRVSGLDGLTVTVEGTQSGPTSDTRRNGEEK